MLEEGKVNVDICEGGGAADKIQTPGMRRTKYGNTRRETGLGLTHLLQQSQKSKPSRATAEAGAGSVPTGARVGEPGS